MASPRPDPIPDRPDTPQGNLPHEGLPLARAGIRGKRVTVMGLGVFGGGAGVARFLATCGARVTVTDLRDEAELRESLEALRGLPITYRLGSHDAKDFRDADWVVVNPAVREDSPFLAAAREAGVPLDTEIHLFLRFCPATVIGVTGSKGKSTTVALLAQLLRATGRAAWAGGNLGGSLLGAVDRIEPRDTVVLELSSFQLGWMAEVCRSPRIAAVTCLFPEHLDRHGSYGAYVEAKAQILVHQTASDLAFLNREDAGSRPLRGLVRGRLLESGLVEHEGELWLASWREPEGLEEEAARPLLPARLAPLRGRHFLACAAQAVAIAEESGIPLEALAEALPRFRGLDHRMQPLGRTRSGILVIDDGASTTPESTLAALESAPSPALLLAGGHPKGASLRSLVRAILTRCRAVALYGEAAPRLADLLTSAGCASRGVTVRVVDRLEEGLDVLLAGAPRDATLLFSPGFSSHDQYRNLADRARSFREALETREGPLRETGDALGRP